MASNYSLLQLFFKKFRSVTDSCSGDFFGSACGDECSARFTTFGTDVDDIVGTFDNFGIMLDDYKSMTLTKQTLERVEQNVDIVEVQAGCRFVENEEGRLGLFLGEKPREFDTLVFTA